MSGASCPLTTGSGFLTTRTSNHLSLYLVALHISRTESNCFNWVAGEINTLQGNLNWVSSREHSLTHPVWDGREDEFLPICNQAESDSANLDHMAEYCVRTGVDANQTLMMLVPEADQNHPTLLKQYPEVTHLYLSIDACKYALAVF